MSTTATPAATGETTITAKVVDASLWWDPFSSLLTELENAARVSDFPLSLETKLKDNHTWILETLSQFKKPSQKSKEALDSAGVKIGSHELNIQPDLRDIALNFSSVACLDEVQSYILVSRSVVGDNLAVCNTNYDTLNLVMLEYYTERQCLLKCTRQIFLYAVYFRSQSGGSFAMDEAQRLISDELESKLLSNLLDLVSSNYFNHMDAELYTLWAEETLIEDNLILDIFFFAYHESLYTCDAKCWKKLCALYEDIILGSYNLQKLAISPEAVCAIYHVKVQLLLILIEALKLDSLLQMIHDDIPFRQGHIIFSEVDIQDVDAIISNFNAIEVKEAGPLILAWAVFICLSSSLPGKAENSFLLEINHIDYVRQAFDASSLCYFLEILQNGRMKDPDVPLASYRRVLRTFISAFIASYEVNLQFEDSNLKTILDILCNIYRGEEMLCIQFWDKESFIDGPIRSLLCNLECEFPYKIIEFVRLLSALCEGVWPSECVFHFLDKSIGLSTPLEIRGDSKVDAVLNVIETHSSLRVIGVEGLIIPKNSRGQVLRMIDQNIALVRWECSEFGFLVLVSILTRKLNTKNFEETIAILDLISRLVTFNEAVCYSLLNAGSYFLEEATNGEKQEKYMRIDVVDIVCGLVKSVCPSANGAVMMSLGVVILTKMLKCFPSLVTAATLKVNIFDVDVGLNSFSSGSWLLSGRLAKMLLFDCEQSDCSLTLSVMDFLMKLLDVGLGNDITLALIVFSVQYVFVNLESWKFKVKHTRWKVTVKVLELMKKCVVSSSSHKKLGDVTRNLFLSDSSVHTVLFRIVCSNAQSLEKLYVSRMFEILDIEGLELAISSALDVLFCLVSATPKDSPSFSVFHHAVLSPMTRPMPVISAAISLIPYFRSPNIQLGAARLLSVLLTVDSPHSLAYNANLGLDDKQIVSLRKSISKILDERLSWNDDLVIASLKLLTSAADNQPGLMTAITESKETSNEKSPGTDPEHFPNNAKTGSLDSADGNVLNTIMHYVRNSEDLLRRKPNVLLAVMNLLRALWQAAPQFTKILEPLKFSDNFWRQLISPVMLISCKEDIFSAKLTEQKLNYQAYRYQCLSNVLDILVFEMFLQKKLLHGELLVNGIPKAITSGRERLNDPKNDKSLSSLKDIISTWCKESLNDVVNACVSYEYDNSSYLHAKAAAALFAVHMVIKLKFGDPGSLSMPLIERITTLSRKLRDLPAFSELLTRYSERGYSGGKDLDNLILSDLFYHIQGEIEDRHIDNKPFKELFQFFLDSGFVDIYKYEKHVDFFVDMEGVHFYDLGRLREDLGLEMWNQLAWKQSIEVAEIMLLYLKNVNVMMLHSNSKLSALRGIITLLHMQDDNFIENGIFTGLEMSGDLACSRIDYICQCIVTMLESLTAVFDATEDALSFLTAQTQLLLLLVRSVNNEISSSAWVHAIKTSGYGLKVLRSCRQSIGTQTAEKFFLLLILNLVEHSCKDLHSDAIGIGYTELQPEASNSILGLLPVLCDCIDHADQCILSLTAIDFMLKGFSSPATWFPIIRKHLSLQKIVLKLLDITFVKTVPVILKLLLNFARVTDGAEMLLNAGILTSLRTLLSDLSRGHEFFLIPNDESFSNVLDKTESFEPIWGLCMAVLTAIIQSLDDSSYSADIVDFVLPSILIENAPMIMLYINAPDFPFEVHEKKRARAVKSNTTLCELNETHNTLTLMCVLVRHWNSWSKVLKEMGSKLREKSIHLLAFISRAVQRPGESPSRDALLCCRPILKEEYDLYKKPPLIHSRNGWFALAARGCQLDLNSAELSSRTTLASWDPSSTSASQTHFSDLIAIELYKIAFLLLKFLCIQAENAVKKAEDVGFIDLAHFPELPMPDILHGLQDQGIVIVTEVCESNKMKQLEPKIQDICYLLLHITIMALYLEYCVFQICGIRPVLGHVESFSKSFQSLVRATDGHLFLKESLQDLKQIVSFVYPELLHGEASY